MAIRRSLIGTVTVFGAFIVLTVAAQAQSTLDEADQQFRKNAIEQAFAGPLGGQRDWSNIASGNHGSIRAASDHATADGRICRELLETVSNAAGDAHGAVVGCRAGDAAWQIEQQQLGNMAPVPADLPADGSGYAPPPVSVDPATGITQSSGSVPIWVPIPGNGNPATQGAGALVTVPVPAINGTTGPVPYGVSVPAAEPPKN